MQHPPCIHVRYAVGRATIRLDSPERRNAISIGMWRDLAEAAVTIATNDDIRLVVIRGEGRVAFSGGADVSDFKQARTKTTATDYDDLVEETCKEIEALPQPTVAIIDGACVGAGASLAAACDLRLATDAAFFSVPAARLGLGYDPRGIARFCRVFGEAATTGLLFTANRLNAQTAHALGALHVVASKQDAENAFESVLSRIETNAPLTLRAAKLALRALRPGADPALQQLAVTAALAADTSADYAEGRAAFAEKRPPRFSGA